MVRKLRLKESDNNQIELKDMNTDLLPVVDFGCYWGTLSEALDDVFVYDNIDIDDFDPDGETYDEIVELVNDEYNGTDVFFDQVLRLAPNVIQKAFDAYGIKMKVVPNSCKWDHPRAYNYSDDTIEFDVIVDTSWVNNKFSELRRDRNFDKFISKNFRSRDGFFSNMPDSVDEYDDISFPTDMSYWKFVSVIVQYIVTSNESIRNEITTDLLYDLEENPEYITCSALGIDR